MLYKYDMRKIALCIGNCEYSQFNKLQYCIADVQAITEKLESLGFEVKCVCDANKQVMCDCFVWLDEAIQESDVCMIYYSGHAFENNGKNYLAPVDVCVDSQFHLVETSINLNDFIGRIQHYYDKIKIIILDACRDEAGEGVRGGGMMDLAPIPIPCNTLIAFGTSSGMPSRENPIDKHGRFTAQLLEFISLQRTPIEIMFKRVREALANATHHEQISWEHSSLIKEFYLNPGILMSGYNYSPDAMKDKDYIAANEKVRDVIDKLKTYDFNTQNTAVNDFKLLVNSEISPEDLFVVGRNIYQSAVGNEPYASYEARRFIRELDSSGFSVENRSHILCGMAYEIYFNKEGNTRERFKIGRYEDVLQLLEENDYFHVNSYISKVLRIAPHREIYIPAEKGHLLRFKVEFDALYGNEEDFYKYGISAVTRGENALSFYTVPSEAQKEYASANNIERKIRKLIAESIVAPEGDVSVEICFKNGEELSEQCFILPSYLKLERQ